MYRLTAFEWLSRSRLEELQTFLDQTERGAQSEFGEFSKWVKGETAGMSDREASDFVDHYYDDLAMVRDVVPRIIRYSQVLIVYGFYEHEVAGLCRLLHAEGVTKKKPKNKLYLHDAKKYLIEQADFKERTFGKAWKYLDSARNVRNAIAHNSGRFRSDEQGNQGKSFVEEEPDLDLDGSKYIDIKKEFNQKLLDNSRESLKALIEEGTKKYEMVPRGSQKFLIE